MISLSLEEGQYGEIESI
ncbi:unnamed protein product [Rotaria sordida]|uniref:Uncharacterized protein n=1 Tax=Rotaria sordida TaxID=392033 RepID=A0A820KD72_9BILA|nr:unnamed protein product [Rotaria sordida]